MRRSSTPSPFRALTDGSCREDAAAHGASPTAPYTPCASTFRHGATENSKPLSPGFPCIWAEGCVAGSFLSPEAHGGCGERGNLSVPVGPCQTGPAVTPSLPPPPPQHPRTGPDRTVRPSRAVAAGVITKPWRGPAPVWRARGSREERRRRRRRRRVS